MKHLKHLFTALLLLCSTVVAAHDFSVRGIYYSISSSTNKTVEVAYRGNYYDSYSNEYTGSVVIPENVTYNGTTYSVTSIGVLAFYGCSGLTNIEIPNSVTSIGGSAFSFCTNLKSITIPNSVTSIGEEAFYRCTGLTRIVIPNSVTSIGNHAFSSCTGLTSVVIGNSVTSIGRSAFGGCPGLTSVVIGNSVKSIGSSAFYDCSGLTSITIPNSVTSIGKDAFLRCNNLTSVELPSSLTIIEEGAFSRTGLIEVTIPEGVTSLGKWAFDNSPALSKVSLPTTLTSIGDNAFESCPRITNITIPNNVTSIGNYAFSGCTGLTSVEIPNSVTSIGDYAFADCSGLTSVTSLIPADELFAIYSNVFDIVDKTTCTLYVPYGAKETYASTAGWKEFKNIVELEPEAIGGSCGANANWTLEDGILTISGTGAIDNASWSEYQSQINTVIIEDGITSIGDEAFEHCTGLTSIVIPNSVTSIGNWAFNRCSGLTSIVIGNSVTSIGESAFRECSGLTNVVIGNSVTSIGKDAFLSCYNLTSVELPSSLTVIEVGAFSRTGLIEVTIPEGVTSLGKWAFDNSPALSKVDLPTTLTSIGDNAFESCPRITNITIPNNVTSIGEEAFYRCTGLTSVVIGNSVTSIGDYAFNGCKGLKTVINFSNLTFNTGSSSNGYVAFYADKVCNLPNGSKEDDFIFGKQNDVNTLLYYLGNATKLTLPADCNGENYVIGANVFEDNTTITSVEIPNSVTSIGEGAFQWCSGLTSVVIGNSVTSIGDWAFYGCSGLTSMAVADGNKVYDSRDNSNAIIETATNTLVQGFQNTIIPNSVTSIGRTAFYGCKGLTSITISNSVTSIGSGAFQYCDGLTSIVIGNSVTSIGDWAFDGCTGLKSITIPNSVTSIGNYAFDGCKGLKTVINFSNLTFSKGSNYNGYVAYYADKVYNVPNGSKEDDFIFGKQNDVNTLLYYLGNATKLTLPADCNGENYVIGANVFKDNTTITSVEIPNSVTSIGNRAFYGCTGLTSVVIGNSVTSIGNWAFSYCTGLGTVVNLSNLPLSKGSVDYGYVAYYADRVINSADISGISLDKSAATLVEGESLTLKATVWGSVGDMPVTWSTSNSSVATVEDGVVTAVAAGTATITATAGGYSATCVVSVEKFNGITSLEQLKNNALYYISQPRHTKGATSWAVDKGGKALKSNVDLGVELSSSDIRQQFAILSIDGGAKRYLYHVGEKKFINKDGSLGEKPVDAVNIKAGAFDNTFMFYFDDAHYINVGGSRQMTIDSWSTPDGGNSCLLENVGNFDPTEVLGQWVTGISLDKSAATLVEGESLTLKATVLGSVGDMPVAWSTSNSLVATVEDGVVTAVAPGRTRITATADGYSATCVVTVEKKVIAVTGITLSETKVTLTEGETMTLIATVTPSNAVNKTVTWSTTNSAAATVKDGVVTAVAAGTATITAKAGGYSATCDVTIEKKIIAVTGILLSESKVTLTEGETMTLIATVAPSDATDKTVTWSTTNSAAATVKDGVVTAVAPGRTRITATADGYSATCVVSVEKFKGITSLEQLKNNALYYISQPHHTKGATSWAVDKGGKALKSNVDLGVELSSSDTRQQFAILSIDGGATRYLYHAGEKKFINKDGSLGEKPVDAVNIIAGAFKYTFMFYFDDAHYINVGGSRQMTIDNWSTPDGGNSCTIVPVGEFDPEMALGIITGIEDIEDVDGEIVVYNLQGNRILDVDNLERGIYIVNGKKVFVK